MSPKRKLATVMIWIAGIASFVVSYFGFIAFGFTTWGTSTRIEMAADLLVASTMFVSFPVFLLFRRQRGLAILLQWSAVILCIAAQDAVLWRRDCGILAKLGAAFSWENANFFFPLMPAVLLTILCWLRENPKRAQEPLSIRQ